MALQKASAQFQRIKPLQFYKIWRETLGEVLVQFVEFQGVYSNAGGNILKVHVKDPLWRQEIHHQGPELLLRFQQALKKAGFSAKEIPVKIETLAKKVP